MDSADYWIVYEESDCGLCLVDEDNWIVDWYLMDERDAVKTGAQVASCA